MDGNNLIIEPGALKNPNREVLNAAARFMEEVCRQWPRLAPELAQGCKIQVTSVTGIAFVIEGGASKSGIILPSPGGVTP